MIIFFRNINESNYNDFCLHPVSCVPNVASFSGLSILDCPSSFPKNDNTISVFLVGNNLYFDVYLFLPSITDFYWT